jgi:basic membrane protein A and related proteins
MRSWKSLIALLLLALIAAGCGDGDTADEAADTEDAAEEETAEETGDTEDEAVEGDSELRAAMVTDVGGLGDQSFNDSAFAGLERAEQEFGIQINVLESASPTDYVGNLTQLAENGFSPIFAVGFLMTDAVAEVAPQFPDIEFAIIDSVVEEANVASLTFEEQQGSYLAGVVAGLMTQEDTDYTTSDEQIVGFLGGLEGPLIQKFQAGYEAGVESVCPDCETLVQYAGTTPEAFNDPAAGQEISLSMNDNGADVIYHASGATGAGLFEAATDRTFLAIGVDSDQAALVPDAPILTSMLKRVDNAVFQATEASVNGNFPAGTLTTYGLEEEGVDLAPFGEFEDLVPEEVTSAVDEARAGIISGEVEVPTEPS